MGKKPRERPFHGAPHPIWIINRCSSPLPCLKGQPKFGSRAIPGLFLGYRLRPGAVFKGEYYVVSLTEYQRVTESREQLAPIVHRVKEVTVPPGHMQLSRSRPEGPTCS